MILRNIVEFVSEKMIYMLQLQKSQEEYTVLEQNIDHLLFINAFQVLKLNLSKDEILMRFVFLIAK